MRIARKLWGIKGARLPFMRLVFTSLFLGIGRFNYAMRLAIGYIHFNRLRERMAEGLPERIEFEQQKNVPPVWQTTEEEQAGTALGVAP